MRGGLSHFILGRWQYVCLIEDFFRAIKGAAVTTNKFLPPASYLIFGSIVVGCHLLALKSAHTEIVMLLGGFVLSATVALSVMGAFRIAFALGASLWCAMALASPCLLLLISTSLTLMRAFLPGLRSVLQMPPFFEALALLACASACVLIAARNEAPRLLVRLYSVCLVVILGMLVLDLVTSLGWVKGVSIPFFGSFQLIVEFSAVLLASFYVTVNKGLERWPLIVIGVTALTMVLTLAILRTYDPGRLLSVFKYSRWPVIFSLAVPVLMLFASLGFWRIGTLLKEKAAG